MGCAGRFRSLVVAVQSPVMAWPMPMPMGLFSMAPSEIGMTVFRREWVVDDRRNRAAAGTWHEKVTGNP